MQARSNGLEMKLLSDVCFSISFVLATFSLLGASTATILFVAITIVGFCLSALTLLLDNRLLATNLD